MKDPARSGGLSLAAAALMGLQAGAGRLFPQAYVDDPWVLLTWIGNDWVTLLLAVPVILTGMALRRRGSARGLLLEAGGLGYGVYNGAFYMLGARLNPFFPLYVLTVVVPALALLRLLVGLDAGAVGRAFARRSPVRVLGGYLVFLATGLTAVWLGIWGAHVFGGRPTPVPPEAFRLVAALDLSLMVPALVAGGVLLWRRRAWGYVIAGIAAIQGALYLTVLTVNSILAVRVGTAQAPGEVPLWGGLVLGTAAAAAVLLGSIEERPPNRLEDSSDPATHAAGTVGAAGGPH